MSGQGDRLRARRDRFERQITAQAERDRQVDLLVAEACNALSQRDALVCELERRAGRALADLRGLGFSTDELAARCGLRPVDISRLCRLASIA